MAMTEFIAAIELSSTKISGIAGKKNEDGTMQVLAFSKADATSYMKKGVVYNLDKTAQAITAIVKDLEQMLNSKIAKVYVGIAGQSIHTIKNVINRTLKERQLITQELVDSVCDENIDIPNNDMTILEVAPQEFRIGNDYQLDPVGVASDHLEGQFMNVVCRDTVKRSLVHSFEKADIEIADLLVAPLAAARLLVPESDRRSGCIFVDFGAETTTIAIFKNDLLRFLTVIPLGSHNITKDLTSLKIEESRAEYLKLRVGDLNYKESDDDVVETFFLDEEKTREVPLIKINDIIKARAEEIIANVWNQIQVSGYHDKLLAGMIITGGGSNLNGLIDLIKHITHIERVKIGNPNIEIAHSKLIKELKEKEANNSLNTILGLLAAGDMNCAKIDKVVEGTLFEGEEMIKKQEKTPEEIKEELRLQQQKKEEEEKIRQEKLKEQKLREEEEEKKRKKKKKKSWTSSLIKKFEEVQKNIFNENDEIKND